MFTQNEVGEEPIEVELYAAASARHALNASFDRMLRPPESLNRQ